MTCESCHEATNASFKQFDCVGCHDHGEVTDLLHRSETDYRYKSGGCYSAT